MRCVCSAALILLAIIASGCTHLQLSRSTLRQAGTITDLEYKQIVSNVAAYHCNPDVLPHFAVVGTGGTSITDQGGATLELEWDTATLARKMLGLQGTREVQEQWTLAPVIHPDKLRAIKAVFQLVVLGHATDPEADPLLKAYLGEDYEQWIERGWYGVGCSRQVPSDACYVTKAGDVHVWVMPDGMESLSRLTLVVLDISTLDPNPPTTKTVQAYYYNDDGKLNRIETSTAPADESKSSGGTNRFRRDFYNPIQSQIQMGAAGKK